MARRNTDRILILGTGVHGGASGELLSKMVASLQAPPGGVVLEEFTEDFDPAGISGFRVWVILGAGIAARGGWQKGGLLSWNGVRVIVTESLADLLERPALKRSAWEDLKLVMQEMGWKNP